MAARITIEEVYKRSEQGVLRPFLCRGSDGETYFVKGRGAGYRGLIGEYACARLGMLLGLPIPAFAIVEVPAELIACSEVEGIWELGAGSAFGSMRVEYVQELAASSLARVPAELQSRVLLFDWWIRNEDRHYTEQGGNPNLLWNIAEGQLVVFDHNLAFDEEFDAEQFRSGHAFRQQLSAFSDPVFQAAEIARLHGAIQHFDAILSETPDVWLTGAVEGGQNFDIDSLRRMLNRYQSPEFWTIQQ